LSVAGSFPSWSLHPQNVLPLAWTSYRKDVSPINGLSKAGNEKFTIFRKNVQARGKCLRGKMSRHGVTTISACFTVPLAKTQKISALQL